MPRRPVGQRTSNWTASKPTQPASGSWSGTDCQGRKLLIASAVAEWAVLSRVRSIESGSWSWSAMPSISRSLDAADPAVALQRLVRAVVPQRLGEREAGALRQAGLGTAADHHGSSYSQRLRRL